MFVKYQKKIRVINIFFVSLLFLLLSACTTVDDIVDAARVADNVDDIVDAARVADNVDDIVDAARVADNVDDITDSARLVDKLGESPPIEWRKFEKWVSDKVLNNEAYSQVYVKIEDNPHLSLEKSRRLDAYLASDGSAWEMKLGYDTDKSNVDPNQYKDYRKMLDAGYIYTRIEKSREPVKLPIKSVNYFFSSEEAAEKFAWLDNAYDIDIWYVDTFGNLYLLNLYP